MPPEADGRLPTYRPLPGRYDELADERGRPREQWDQLVEVFSQLGPAEIDALIAEAIAATGAASIKDMSKVMGFLKGKAQGRADMGALGARIKQKLG